MCVIFVCSFVSPVSCTLVGLSLVFGQVGLTIDWNWTSQDRGIFSCNVTKIWSPPKIGPPGPIFMKKSVPPD